VHDWTVVQGEVVLVADACKISRTSMPLRESSGVEPKGNVAKSATDRIMMMRLRNGQGSQLEDPNWRRCSGVRF
jgi:hypothetical protein